MMPLFPEWIFELAFMTQTTALLYGREFQLPNSFNTLKNSLGKEIISLLSGWGEQRLVVAVYDRRQLFRRSQSAATRRLKNFRIRKSLVDVMDCRKGPAGQAGPFFSTAFNPLDQMDWTETANRRHRTGQRSPTRPQRGRDKSPARWCRFPAQQTATAR